MSGVAKWSKLALVSFLPGTYLWIVTTVYNFDKFCEGGGVDNYYTDTVSGLFRLLTYRPRGLSFEQ
jgi:hypothetical protein